MGLEEIQGMTATLELNNLGYSWAEFDLFNFKI